MLFSNGSTGYKLLMMSSINQFSSQDTIEFFNEQGLKTKVERGNRVFPLSDKASDVTKYLLKNAENCKINLNELVLDIKCKENGRFELKTTQKSYIFDKVIVATGGKSYPATGSTGDGYKFAKKLGLDVVAPKSALVPIRLNDYFCKSLQGLSLKNVELHAVIGGKEKALFGEMLFTGDGISGPLVLSLSSYISSEKNVELWLDFKPALSHEQLENRILREFDENKNKNLSYIIRGLLPSSLVGVFLNRVKLDGERKVNGIKQEERKRLVEYLKHFSLSFKELYPVETGIVTSGGINLKEINPKTMECKKIKNLYFIGEVIDVDCLTGGFNLQTAFSTAFACANNIY